MVASNSQVKIKVCGMTSLKDTLVAVEEGADAVGFIFYKKSPRSVTMKVVREIILELPPFIDTVGVFVDETEEKIKALVKKNPKITSARKTLGNWDLLFSIVTENQKEFHQTVKEIKSLLLNEITSHQILSAYNEPYFTAFPKILSKPTSQHL